MPGRESIGSALGILAASMLVHYGYKLAPLPLRPDAQNLCIAVTLAAGVIMWAWHRRGWLVILACGLWVAEEVLRFWCSLVYMLRGAPATDPGDQCTGLIRLDLNYLGVFAASLLLVAILRAHRRRSSS